MSIPGSLFSSSRLRILSGSAPTVAGRYGGVAFGVNGRLCIDTDTPAGSFYMGGFRLSSTGAIYGVNSASAPHHYNAGYGFDSDDRLIFGDAAPTIYNCGDGFVSTGRLATTNA